MFCGGETVTESTKKVPTAAIEAVRKAIQMTPDCTTTEITKLQAVQALTPDIQQMQSKGYGWTAIADLLSEHGIPINVVTLKGYLQRTKAGAGKSRHKRKGSPDAEKRPARGSGEDPRKGAARATAAAATAPKEETAEPLGGPPNRTPVGGAKAPRALDSGTVSRRSAFVPEEDSDDI